MTGLLYRATAERPGADEAWGPVSLARQGLESLATESGLRLLYRACRGGDARGAMVLDADVPAPAFLGAVDRARLRLGYRDWWIRPVACSAPLDAFDRPVFLLSAPRAGSTLLFDLLRQSPDFWTIGAESAAVIQTIPHLHPNVRGSHALAADDADEATRRQLAFYWLIGLIDRDGRVCLETPQGPARVRFLEKTPRNAFRVAFLRRLFPDARFVYLYRDPRESLASIMEVWDAAPERLPFHSLESPPGWTGRPWRLLIPPGWPTLVGQDLADIAAYQWQAANAAILDALDDLPPDRWCGLTFADLIADPAGQLRRVVAFAGLRFDDRLAAAAATMAPSRMTLTPYRPDKWKVRAAAIEPRLPELSATVERARQRLAERSR